MRILVSFPYALGAVGVGRTALSQVNGLAARGHKVFVAAPGVADAAVVHPEVRVFETLKVAGQRVPRRLAGQARRELIHDLRTRLWLRWLHREAPLEVLHSWPLSGASTMRAAGRLGIVVVREAPNTHTGHAYDVVEREAASLGLVIPKGNSHYRDPDHLAREEREWALADAILAPSEAVAESFVARGFAPERVVRHRYGCELPELTMPGDSGRAVQALFLGAAEPRKGLHHALAAWRRSVASHQGTLRIAGSFMPGYRECIEELLDGSGVEVLGFVDDPRGLLAQSDVLLLPSIEEGSAIVTYEAQAVGCIPLVSHQAGALLEAGRHGLVHEAGDVDTLVEQLDAVSQDLDLRESLREACLAERARLGWDVAASELERAYRMVIARKRGLSGCSTPTGVDHVEPD